ncbi:ankyrin repeat domain-containing protein 49 [Anabrus simplex]|uniref:ankyrin repeat domain-containing protein 49 n=1 Tax=Anabrus simplex TaxID=316456 RepID=UPI0035A329FC
MSELEPPAFVSSWDDDAQDVEEDPTPHVTPHREILWAAENGALDVVKTIVEADPLCVNIRDKDGYTPLHRACYNNHVDVVDYLLSKGANIAAETEDKWQPLHSASRWNNYRCVSSLLQLGADVNAASKGGQTPLHLAAANSYARETLMLLLMHPCLKPDLRNASDETAASIARRSGKYYYLFELAEPCINEFKTVDLCRDLVKDAEGITLTLKQKE